MYVYTVAFYILHYPLKALELCELTDTFVHKVQR